jgi:carboxymethylenebutenolidase
MTVKVPSKSGGEFSAYVALPLRPGPAVVVVQEIFGANANIRSICDFLASRQFVAIAPDFYWRSGEGIELDPTTDTEKARAIRAKTDDNLASDNAADAMEFIKKHPHCTGRVGVAGYCWGGLISYLTAVRHKPEAAVCYYGVGIEKHLDQAKNLSCPTLFHYAGQDQFAGPEVAAKVKETFAGDKRVVVHEYPKSGHAFARHGGAHFDAKAADLADMRTLSFFVEHLFGPK